MTEFVIRMADGSYFVSIDDGTLITTLRPEHGKRFRSRFEALQQMGAGSGFDMAGIKPLAPPDPEYEVLEP